MNVIQNPNRPDWDVPLQEKAPDWETFPAWKQQETVQILVDMLISSQVKTQENSDDDTS